MKWLIRAVHMGASFWADQEGPTVTEYAVMLALIIIVALAAITLLGTKVQTIFTSASTALPSGGDPP